MARRPVRIGVQVAQYATTWPHLLAAAQKADACGIDLLVDWDHFFGPGPESDATSLECWTLLAAWAAATSRVTLGPLVSGIGYRNPDLVADMARTVDHVSGGGRFVLGVGAGFKERDYREYGYAFPATAQRLDDLEDGLRRIRARLRVLRPAPRAPIPILIGGGGERRTLGIVARHADIWHTFAEGEAFARKSRVLERHCAEIGRDPAQIERSVLVAGDPDTVGGPLLALGATLFIVRLDGRPEIDLAPVMAWLAWRDRVNEAAGRS